jgi:hypothetical protein
MSIGVPIYGDGAGRAGFSETATATITVDRDGTRVGEAPRLGGAFPVPAGTGRYRVAIEATRGAPFNLSTRNSVVWTFRSGHVDGDKRVALPLSVIRFAPKLDPHNAAPADSLFAVPVEVRPQPGSEAGRVGRWPSRRRSTTVGPGARCSWCAVPAMGSRCYGTRRGADSSP